MTRRLVRGIGRTLFALAGALALSACPPAERGRCGPPGEDVANEGWIHVDEGTQLAPRHNPPASGPHYPIWARYRIHDQVVPRGYWIHNLEHGAVVLLHRPDAPAEAIAALRQAWTDLPPDPACGHRRALLTADPDLGTPVAAVVADFVVEGARLDSAAVRALAERCRGQAPEDVCADGFYPP